MDQGGVSVDGEVVKDVKTLFAKEKFSGDGVIFKRGKKNFMKVVVK